MMEKIKTTLSIILILLLFPYVAIMLSGQAVEKVPKIVPQAEEEVHLNFLEQWVMEILPGQMPVTYEIEALKAQAVIIRSNLAYHMQEEGFAAEQLDKSWLERMGLNSYTAAELREIWGEELYEAYYEKIRRAVEETCGKVLQYQGRYVDLPYHAISAGCTRDGGVLGEGYLYLQRVECPEELTADEFLTVVELDKRQLADVEIVSMDEAGYVTRVRVGDTMLAGEAFRMMWDLPSSCFVLQEQESCWVVTCKGLGHGFGLSMYQAQLQAGQGKNFQEILQYFYRETILINME